jgi:hypothetical protein
MAHHIRHSFLHDPKTDHGPIRRQILWKRISLDMYLETCPLGLPDGVPANRWH